MFHSEEAPCEAFADTADPQPMRPADVDLWTCEDVLEWLAALGPRYARLAPAFRKQLITGYTLALLAHSTSDLIALGLSTIGDRLFFQRKVKELMPALEKKDVASSIIEKSAALPLLKETDASDTEHEKYPRLENHPKHQQHHEQRNEHHHEQWQDHRPEHYPVAYFPMPFHPVPPPPPAFGRHETDAPFNSMHPASPARNVDAPHISLTTSPVSKPVAELDDQKSSAQPVSIIPLDNAHPQTKRKGHHDQLHRNFFRPNKISHVKTISNSQQQSLLKAAQDEQCHDSKHLVESPKDQPQNRDSSNPAAMQFKYLRTEAHRAGQSVECLASMARDKMIRYKRLLTKERLELGLTHWGTLESPLEVSADNYQKCITFSDKARENSVGTDRNHFRVLLAAEILRPGFAEQNPSYNKAVEKARMIVNNSPFQPKRLSHRQFDDLPGSGTMQIDASQQDSQESEPEPEPEIKHSSTMQESVSSIAESPADDVANGQKDESPPKKRGRPRTRSLSANKQMEKGNPNASLQPKPSQQKN